MTRHLIGGDDYLEPLSQNMIGHEVKTHLNLSNALVSKGINAWSVLSAATGRREGHAYSLVQREVSFDVAPRGNMQAIITLDKDVHAFCRGVLAAFSDDPNATVPVPGDAIPIRYSPNKSGFFFFLRADDSGDFSIPVIRADAAYSSGGIGTGWKFVAQGVEDMDLTSIQHGLLARQGIFRKNYQAWEELREKKGLPPLTQEEIDFYWDMGQESVGRRHRIGDYGSYQPRPPKGYTPPRYHPQEPSQPRPSPGEWVATPAMIDNVITVPEARRKGLAGKLLKHARKQFDFVNHSPQLTREGRSWSEAVGRIADQPIPSNWIVKQDY